MADEHDHTDQAAAAVGAARTPPDLAELPRVVVGVDGSEASEAALVWALEEARLRRAVVHAVHAWQYPFELAAGTYSVPVPAGEMRIWAEQIIDDALAQAEADPSVPVVREPRNGPAVEVLMEASHGAELLVVGTRGHSRVTGLFLGSVSQYLAVHAPCPVLVVHGPPAAGRARRTPESTLARAPANEESVLLAADGEGLEEIPEEECLALLGGTSVGRLVVVREGQPLAFPVNYVLDGRTVAVRTDTGTKLDWATLGPVAFEVDQIDEETKEGWSVLVTGVGRDVTEGVDAWSERLRRQRVEPWAPGDKEHWIAVAMPHVSGRRIRHISALPAAPLART